MEVCIIGGGPSAFLLSKQLLKNKNNNITVFEKSKKPLGLFNTAFSPDSEIKESIFKINNSNRFKVIQKHITPQNFRKETENFDHIVFAMGGEEKKLDINGDKELITLGSKITSDYKHIGDNVAVIGNGNIALDIARNLYRLGTDKIYIIGRKGIADTKFTVPVLKQTLPKDFSINKRFLTNFENNKLDDIKKTINCKKNIPYKIDKSLNKRIVNKKYEIFSKGFDFSEKQSKINFLFNEQPIKILKNENNKLQLETTNEKLLCDKVISAIGYDSKDLSEFIVNKPYSIVGWSGTMKNNINDLLIETKNAANAINKINNNN